MRIIGGKLRGRKIEQPSLDVTRPTKDRVREAVFNMVARDVVSARVLDLFAGSGAYGLEALSRGAMEAVFVEKSAESANVIKNNIDALRLPEQGNVIIGDVFNVIGEFGDKKRKFDIIFCDPPYNNNMSKKTLIMINQYDILNPFGLVIIEHSADEALSESVGGVSVCRQRTYKDINISIFQKND